MSLFQTVGLPWNLALALAAVVGACALILDANWMAAMVRGGPQAARPPLFRSPLPLPQGWRRMAWLAGFVFGLAPLMMMGVTGVRYTSAPSVQVGLLIALVVTLVVLIWNSANGAHANGQRRRRGYGGTDPVALCLGWPWRGAALRRHHGPEHPDHRPVVPVCHGPPFPVRLAAGHAPRRQYPPGAGRRRRPGFDGGRLLAGLFA